MPKVGRPVKQLNIKSDEKLESEEEVIPDMIIPESLTPKPEKMERITAREVDIKAEEVRASRALPKVPAKQVDFDTLTKWLALLDETMWSHVMIYVYRHFPIIDRLKLDPKGVKYIDVVTEPPLTMQYMVEKHGGGKYGFSVVNTDIPKGQNAQIMEARLSISMSQHEPNIDFKELVIEDRENIPYVHRLRAEGRIDEKGNPMDRQQLSNPNNGQVDNNAMVSLVKEFMALFQRMNADQQANLKSRIGTEEDSLGKSIGNLLLEKMKQDDPKSFITMLTGLMSAMKAQSGEGSNQATNMMDRVIQMQAEHNKTIIDMMKLQFESSQQRDKEPPEEKKSPIEQLKELLELAKMIKGGGSMSADRGIADIALDYVKELGAPLLTTINNIIALKRGQPTNLTPNPIPNPNMQPQMQPQPTALPMGNLDAQASTSASEQPLANPTANQLIPLINQFGGILISKIQAGTRGWEFAEDLVRFYGPAPHAMVAKFGVEGVINTFKQIPELWNQLEPVWGEEYLKKWVEEFIGYEEILAKIEDQENDNSEIESIIESIPTPTETPIETPSEKLYKKGRKVN